MIKIKRYKSYKFKVFPTIEQENLIQQTFGCVRFLYNKMLADKIKHYEETKKYYKCEASWYKKDHPFLKDVDSHALCSTKDYLDTAFKRFFREKNMKFPKFKSKKTSKKSYTTNYVSCHNIYIQGEYLRLPKVGMLRMNLCRTVPDNFKLKKATISQTSTGKYYASILYEYEVEIKSVEIKQIVGLDFSMKELYVSSDNIQGNYPRFYRGKQSRLAREQRKLSHMQKDSNNYIKQKHKIASIHEKIGNQRQDFLHKQSTQIANEYDAVCIENLNMSAMKKQLHFGKSASDNGWGMFTGYLKYKLEDRGKQLIKIDKWFPSSKMCSNCGQVKDELSLSERVYICNCGFEIDRDLNAAINIKNEGMRLLQDKLCA